MAMKKGPQTQLEAGYRGINFDDVKEDTKIAQAYLHIPPTDVPNLPTAQPIYATAAWRLNTVKDFEEGLKGNTYIYTRADNPTVNAAEAAVNVMEGGSGTVCFSSGNAGIFSALSAFLKAGDHVVATFPMYVGAYQIIKSLARSGIESTFVSHSVEEFKKAAKPNTRVFYAQNPTEHDAIDMEGLAQLAASLGNIVTIVDASSVSPYCLKPIKYGIDVSFHTATKYLGGHSDLSAGVVTARTVQQYNQILAIKRLQGAVLSPFDAFLLLRGIYTLPVRMERLCDNAEKVVAYLQSHPQVERVYYPSLESFNGHEFAKKQMNRYASRVCCVVKGGIPAGVAFIHNMRIIQTAITFGGITTIAEHSATEGHGPARMNDEERRALGVEDGLIRLSIGLEDPEDIIKDLKHCLEKAAEACKV
jgi:methionine-gamma-lyase